MATFSSTSTRLTIDGTYKSFVGGTGNSTTVINYSSGDAPAAGDAGRFLLWKKGSVNGNWEVRFIQSATATTVTVTDGGFSTAPPNNANFVISTNLQDVVDGINDEHRYASTGQHEFPDTRQGLFSDWRCLPSGRQQVFKFRINTDR